jgi:hypothetical protein
MAILHIPLHHINIMFTFIGMTADGQFSVHTEVKVRDFQTNNGLNNDGVVGASTWTALETPKSSAWRTIAPASLVASSTMFVILLV